MNYFSRFSPFERTGAMSLGVHSGAGVRRSLLNLELLSMYSISGEVQGEHYNGQYVPL
jgi:hypothetical protein